MFCAKCGYRIEDEHAKYCPQCGYGLSKREGLSPEDVRLADDSEDNKYCKAAIGSVNQNYYLNIFAKLRASQSARAGWHWPAFFATLPWLAYRKMWILALGYLVAVYFALVVALFVGGALTSLYGDGVGLIFRLTVLLAITLSPPVLANYLYYRHCQKKIAWAKASFGQVDEQISALKKRGGTSRVALGGMTVLVLLLVIGVVASVVLPRVQETRSAAVLNDPDKPALTDLQPAISRENNETRQPNLTKEPLLEGMLVVPHGAVEAFYFSVSQPTVLRLSIDVTGVTPVNVVTMLGRVDRDEWRLASQRTNLGTAIVTTDSDLRTDPFVLAWSQKAVNRHFSAETARFERGTYSIFIDNSNVSPSNRGDVSVKVSIYSQ